MENPALTETTYYILLSLYHPRHGYGIMQETQQLYGYCDNLRLMGTKEAAVFGADALVICTEWNHFKAPNFATIKQALKQPLIVDGRNLFDPGRMRDHGFHYYGIGRGESVNR